MGQLGHLIGDVAPDLTIVGPGINKGFTKLRQVASAVVVLGVAGALAYLSLKRAPQFSEVSWLPMWLRVWSDAHGISRSALGFGAFALMVALMIPARSRRWTSYFDVLSYAVFFEVAQIWIPTRVSDLKDVGAAAAGIAIAAVVVELIRLIPRSGVSQRSRSADTEVTEEGRIG